MVSSSRIYLLPAAATFLAVSQADQSTIAGYVASSHISGSPIDRDLLDMRQYMARGDFVKATEIYKYGANADPYARIALQNPLTHDVSSASGEPIVVLGMNENGQAVRAHISSSAKGSTSLFVMYNETANTQETNDDAPGPCRSRGFHGPQTQGCLAPTGGLIIPNYGAVNYHYDVSNDNGFWATLHQFSEHEAENMFHCQDKCPYPEYEKFYQYYGQLDYGAVWLEAALNGRSTQYDSVKLAHAQEDFSRLNTVGRTAAIETAAVTMNVRTHINRIMTEWAIDRCREHCQHDGSSCHLATKPWDQAVGHYVGSLVQPNEGGYQSGHLYYGMANELCQSFATCGKNGDETEGTSAVNRDILEQFQRGQQYLVSGKCDMADLTYGHIVHLMTVPLIQGTLRAAYRLQYTHKKDPEERGRGAAFAASILPDLYSCSPTDASIVYNELRLSSLGTPNYSHVRNAFERNYQCLSVTCEDIGGLYDSNNQKYYNEAQPCGSRRATQKRESQSNGWGLWNYFGRAFLLCNMGVFAVLMLRKQRSANHRWNQGHARQLLSQEDSSSFELGMNLGTSHEYAGQSVELTQDGASANYHQIGDNDDDVML